MRVAMKHVARPIPPPLSDAACRYLKTPGKVTINRDVWPYGDPTPEMTMKLYDEVEQERLRQRMEARLLVYKVGALLIAVILVAYWIGLT